MDTGLDWDAIRGLMEEKPWEPDGDNGDQCRRVLVSSEFMRSAEWWEAAEDEADGYNLVLMAGDGNGTDIFVVQWLLAEESLAIE